MKRNFYFALSLSLLSGVFFAEEASKEDVDKILQRESLLVGERRVQAEQSFQEGMLLYRQQNYQDAVKHFKKALELDPSHPEAKTYLIRVQSVMGLEVGGLQSKSTMLEDRVKVQRAEQNLDLSFKLDQADLAYETLKSKTYTDAGQQLKDMEDVLTMYESALSVAQSLQSRNDREKMSESINIRIGELKEDMTDIKSRIQSKMREDAQQRMQRERVENEQYLVNRIQNILDAAEESLEKEDFDGAVRLADDVLTVDPENRRARSIKSRSLRARHIKVDEEIVFERNKELTRSLLKIKDAFIPYSSGVVYPDNWDQIKERQEDSIGASTEAPAWEQRLERSLDRHTNYSCPAGTPLREVLSQLSDISGLNIVLDPKVLQEMDEADLEIRNEIKYEGLPLRYILNWVVREVGLTYTLKFDVIFVSLKKTQADRLMLQIYDIQDLLASKQSFTPPNLEDGFVDGEDEGGLEIELGDDDLGGEAISSDVIVQMIQDSITGDWDDPDTVGILLRPIENGALLVKNTPRVHGEIIELLRELRKTSALQVEIEARSLTVSKNFFREVGLDWTGLDTTAPLDVGVSTGFFDNSDEDFSYKGAIVNGLTSNIANNLGFFVEHSILGALQAKVLLRAVEQDTDTTTLISPRIVLVNNILGYIRLGETQNYIAGYEIGENDNGGIQPEIESLDEGQLLAVTATISSDRKYITVRIHPDFQTVDIPRTVTLTGTDTTNNLVTGTTQVQFNLPIDLPRVSKQRIRTTAVIPDRGVLIMGGISESSEEDSTRGVPVLSKVPFLGRLFRSDSKSDSSLDTMFLLHGRIILFDELEAGL